MDTKPVYIVFTATPYKVGKMIRRVTGEEFNHASIALDEHLTQMYSFARRYCNTPLYGGFVAESTSRYNPDGKETQVKICRLDVTQAQYDALAARLQSMLEQQELYLYNFLSALAVPIRRAVQLRDSYTCVEFCVEILHSLGVDVTPGKYYTVGDLVSLLEDKVIYTGPLSPGEAKDESYYAKRPVSHPVLKTLRGMLALVPRLRK